MNTTFTIPEGFELKQTSENQFEIVPKIQDDQYNTPGDFNEIQNEQMRSVISNRNPFTGFNKTQERINPHGSDTDRDQMFENDYGNVSVLHEMYKTGEIQGLNRHEMDLLRFCHNTDMRKFLKENVWDKPIRLEGDSEGNFWLADKY